MDILIWSAVLAASLAVLIKGADVFVEQAAFLARVLGISQLVIGVSVVALGTSLPELAASMYSVSQGAGEFVAGTVIGSNIANIAFIMGAAALAFRGFAVSKGLLTLDMPVMILAALMLYLMCMDGQVNRLEGGLLLIMYGLYLTQVVRRSMKDEGNGEKKEAFKPICILWLVLSGAAIYLGAKYTVEAAVELTTLLGLGDVSILALTVVAVGSSLPELVVTLTAARKDYHDLSLGNVVGSNVCNSFLVMGGPAVIKSIPASQAVLSVGVPFMLSASLILFIFGMRGQVDRTQGVFLLLIFVFYLCKTAGVM